MASPEPHPDFSRLRVAVVGDLVADHYLFARPRRLSREAPVMVLSHEHERMGAGGAANVARNLRSLGARVQLFGVVGHDERGRDLERELDRDGVDLSGLERVDGWTTPTKTRILAAEPRRSLQQILRIDREPEHDVDEGVQRRVAERVRALSDDVDAVVVSDYEYGVAGAPLGQVARQLAERGRVVVLDPRFAVDAFAGVTAMTPNMEELAHFTHTPLEALDDPRRLREAAHALVRDLDIRFLLVTRGNGGMALFGEDLDPKGLSVTASGAGDVTDVCGAGDTAAAVFALALASDFGPARSMQLANAASGVVVMEHGAAVCTPAQLSKALISSPAPVPLDDR